MLRLESAALRTENEILRAENAALRAENAALQAESTVLHARVRELEARWGRPRPIRLRYCLENVRAPQDAGDTKRPNLSILWPGWCYQTVSSQRLQ